MRRTPFSFGLLAGGGALLAFAIFLGVGRLSTIIVMLAASTFFTLGLERPVRALMRRGMRRGVAVALLSIGILLVGVLAAVLVVPELIYQAQSFVTGLPEHLSGTTIGEGAAEVLTPQ